MIIYDKKGTVLYKTDARTVRRALEEAVSGNVFMGNADFRRANLKNGSFDGLQAPGACFWGADLTGSDMGLADLSHCDFRHAELVDTCFAESDLSGCAMQDAYFFGAIFEGAMVRDAAVSCPSFWQSDFSGVRHFENVRYEIEGENAIVLDVPPLVVRGLGADMMMAPGLFFWGGRLYRHGNLPRKAQKDLFRLKATIDRLLLKSDSCFAKKHDLKIQARSNPS